MNKIALLADLETIFHAVLTEKLDTQNSDGDWNFYRVKVIDNIATDSVTDKVIGFRVYKEGDIAEEAYYVGRRPSAQDTSTFRSEVQTALDNAIQGNQLKIKAGWVVRTDEQNEKVDIEVMRGDPGSVVLQYAVVYRDGASLGFEWYTK